MYHLCFQTMPRFPSYKSFIVIFFICFLSFFLWHMDVWMACVHNNTRMLSPKSEIICRVLPKTDENKKVVFISLFRRGQKNPSHNARDDKALHWEESEWLSTRMFCCDRTTITPSLFMPNSSCASCEERVDVVMDNTELVALKRFSWSYTIVHVAHEYFGGKNYCVCCFWVDIFTTARRGKEGRGFEERWQAVSVYLK